jgi:uncharacterized membrane protein YdjX (TVP38/TMEM64 family)
MALIASTLPALGLIVLLWLIKPIGAWLHEHGQAGLALYIGGFAITCGLAILPTQTQAALGGWTYGLRLGFVSAMTAIMGGAVIGYVIARLTSRERVTTVIAEQPRWKAIYDALLKGGLVRTLVIVTLLRLSPASPFALTNLVLAATRVSIGPYLLGTAIGLAPRTCVVVYTAAKLNSLEAATPMWVYFAGIGVTIVALGVIGYLANHAVVRVTGTNGRAAQAEETSS